MRALAIFFIWEIIDGMEQFAFFLFWSLGFSHLARWKEWTALFSPSLLPWMDQYLMGRNICMALHGGNENIKLRRGFFSLFLLFVHKLLLLAWREPDT